MGCPENEMLAFPAPDSPVHRTGKPPDGAAPPAGAALRNPGLGRRAGAAKRPRRLPDFRWARHGADYQLSPLGGNGGGDNGCGIRSLRQR